MYSFVTTSTTSVTVTAMSTQLDFDKNTEQEDDESSGTASEDRIWMVSESVLVDSVETDQYC